MADRYWIGGAGSWNSTAKWSTTSGGSGGASVPTSADNAIFDANSGAAHFTVTVTDNSTCANLTITPEPIVGVTEFAVSNGFVIAGTFSTSGTTGSRRIWFRSSTYGLMRDMQIAAIGSVSDVDFRDIRVTGAGGTLSGTRIGDLRGNSGITFSTPKTVYWNLPAGSSWDQNAWAATSGGAVSTDNFPLAQDTAVIENTGLNNGSSLSLSLAIPYIGSIDMSSRTLSVTLSIFANTVYGNWKNGSGVAFSGASTITFSGRKTQTITSAGKTLSFPVTVDSYGGKVELADALSIGSQNLTVTNGTFDTKGYAVTAGTLVSSNSNVRTINLGSSTVTLSAASPAWGMLTSTNATLNAGTSSIICTAASAQIQANLSFYNVSFTSSTAGTVAISGINTFNSIVISAPASAGLTQFTFDSNQTINGTLTVSGASSIRRIFLRSDTLGTQRDLTVGTLAATDCDFRDIDILGAAAGSTPTRAGDCGGNAGITFPAPKTVYWNLAGAQNWSATAWAASSGGTPDINNFPLAQDTAVFDNTGAAGTVTVQTFNIGTFDAGTRTSAMTLSGSGTPAVYGNWLFGTGVTSGNNATTTFAGRDTQTITSNGVAFGGPITIDCVTGTVQLADALILISSTVLLVTSGTFDAVSYNITSGRVSIGVGTLSTFKMGSGTWTLSGNGNVWVVSSQTNLNFYKGTANIVLSNDTTTSRSFFGGGLSYNKLTIGGTTTSTTTISSNNQFTELASTKTVAHTIALGSTTQTFGAWTVTGTAGNVVTVTGTGTTHVIAGARVTGVDYLAMGTIGFAATSPGEFYAGANSTGTNATIIKTAAPAPVTRYWVGGSESWTATYTGRWSATSGGPTGASVPTSADAVVFDSLSSSTAYTVTCTATQLRCGSLTMAGPASGNVTWAGTAPLAIHDSVNLAATGITRTYTGGITLSGSSTGKTFTTNGVTIAGNPVVNGVGCGWSLGSAWSDGNAGTTLTVTNGSFDTANFSVTIGGFSSSNSNTRSLLWGSSTVTVQALPSGFTNAINFTFSAGTSSMVCTNNGTFNGGGLSFNNVIFTAVSAGTVTLNGSNTFNDLSFTGLTSVGLKNISFTANQTVNGTFTLSAGTNATMRTFVVGSFNNPRTLTCAAVSATDTDFRDITIAGAAAPVSGTRLGDCGRNSGITFDAAKTVYWNLAGNNNWSATAWATSIGGTPVENNFPLAQDAAVFTSTSPASGATTTINAAWNIGTIDMSARIAGTMAMTLAMGSAQPTIYGNWINGTGTTLTSAGGILTFGGSNTQTITSAGVNFQSASFVSKINSSLVLQDAFSSISSVAFTSGTLNLNGYNLTTSASFGSSSSPTLRSVLLGGGTLSMGASGSFVFDNPFGAISIVGPGTVSMTSASAKTFVGSNLSYADVTLNQGGAGTLTITGNNTFANITNTYKATGATTIALGTTTQRVGAFGASGEAGRVLTVTGTSATSPATLVFTGSGQATTATTDYLTITGVRAYSLDTTWYAGANSTNNGSLGWYFVAGGGGAVTAFIIEASTAADSQSSFATFSTASSETSVAADSQSSLASFGVGISETVTASEAQAAGLICLGTLSESATAADVAAAFQAYLGAVAESTTATDLIAASLTLNAAISELTTGSEQVAATLSFSASVSELVAAADSLSGGLLFLSSISEATTAEEVVAAGLVFNQVIAEAATVEDVLIAIAAFNAVVPELVSGSDVAQALLTVGGSINEALVALDESVVSLTISREVSESTNSSDSYSSKFTAASYINEQSVVTFGPISVTTIRFDYEAVKDLYSRKRTVYVSRSSVSSERVVVVPIMNRTVYVPRGSVSAERTGMVSVVDREVYVSGRSTSADRTTSVDE